ncbi:hypothetical protein D3C86_2169470 [compost metagenome]
MDICTSRAPAPIQIDPAAMTSREKPAIQGQTAASPVCGNSTRATIRAFGLSSVVMKTWPTEMTTPSLRSASVVQSA